MAERALVGNAGDPQQIKWARRRERDAQERLLRDIKAVLEIPEARRVLAHLLSYTGVYDERYETSVRMHFYAGQASVGFYLSGLLNQAKPDADLGLMQEMRERARRAVTDADAVRTHSRGGDDETR